jgi:mono/diheme cytochrome c family protein
MPAGYQCRWWFLLALVSGKASAGEKEFFETRIRPVLETNCLLCHGGAKIRGGLEVTSRASLLKGGEHGPAVVPGAPDKSLLIRVVRYNGKVRMPPRGKLDERQIADLVDWVKRGAPWPAAR